MRSYFNVDSLKIRPLEKATIYAFFDSPNATRNARLIIYRYNDEFNVEADPIINVKAKVGNACASSSVSSHTMQEDLCGLARIMAHLNLQYAFI